MNIFVSQNAIWQFFSDILCVSCDITDKIVCVDFIHIWYRHKTKTQKPDPCQI